MKRRREDYSTANDAGNAIKGGSSGNYLQAFIDSLEDELVVIDRDYRIVEANNIEIYSMTGEPLQKA